eukprot:768754-Hanusia_phi.AAC.3
MTKTTKTTTTVTTTTTSSLSPHMVSDLDQVRSCQLLVLVLHLPSTLKGGRQGRCASPRTFGGEKFPETRRETMRREMTMMMKEEEEDEGEAERENEAQRIGGPTSHLLIELFSSLLVRLEHKSRVIQLTTSLLQPAVTVTIGRSSSSPYHEVVLRLSQGRLRLGQLAPRDLELLLLVLKFAAGLVERLLHLLKLFCPLIDLLLQHQLSLQRNELVLQRRLCLRGRRDKERHGDNVIACFSLSISVCISSYFCAER